MIAHTLTIEKSLNYSMKNLLKKPKKRLKWKVKFHFKTERKKLWNLLVQDYIFIRISDIKSDILLVLRMELNHSYTRNVTLMTEIMVFWGTIKLWNFVHFFGCKTKFHFDYMCYCQSASHVSYILRMILVIFF